jgi:protein-disulfide isomerase
MSKIAPDRIVKVNKYTHGSGKRNHFMAKGARFFEIPGRGGHKGLSVGLWAGLMLVGVVLSGCAGASTPAQATATPQSPRALGPVNAPVTIIEYGDFGCSTCQAWERLGVLHQIIAKYGDKLRFEWRDLPIITPESPQAAEAAYCASDQGQFWPYHDLLYQKAPALALTDLKNYAVQIGLDTAKFNTCLDSGQHKAEVDASLHDGLQRGFRATPAFLINGKPLLGPPSFDQLAGIIDSSLK